MSRYETLHCYASGDGALHFCYLKDKKSCKRVVTLEEAKDYLANSPKASHLRLENWKVVLINDAPVLVGNVKRIDESTLAINDKPFFYKIDESSSFWNNDGHCMDHFLTITCNHNGKTVNVVNYSLRMQLRHFINNESELSPALG
jgi:hypothetical protein